MAHLDDRVVREFIESVGDETAKMLFALFADETRARVARMKAPALGGDLNADLRREAHSLKSAAATYGLGALSAMALALEQACDAGDTGAAAREFDALEAESESALTALLDFL